MGGFLATDANGEVTNLRARRKRLHRRHHGRRPRRGSAGDMDRRGRLHDRRPRIIDNAYVIEELSFTEAMELCNFGAKVIYPPTIYPVYHKNIPILVKNTFNPSAPGTKICSHPAACPKPIKGISSINDTCLVTITSLCMVGVIGVNSESSMLSPSRESASSLSPRPRVRTTPPSPSGMPTPIGRGHPEG